MFVVSADSPASLLPLINSYCLKNSIPFISVGYLNDISTFGPLVLPGESGCVGCGSIRMGFKASGPQNGYGEVVARLNGRFKSATFPPVNSAAASLAASDIIKFLGKIGSPAELPSVNQRVGLHDKTLKIEFQDFSRHSECIVCQQVYF